MSGPARRPVTGWSHFAHVADVGVEGRGPTLAAALEQAAVAMAAVTLDPQRVAPRQRFPVHCQAPDPELLLLDWLNALLWIQAAQGVVLGRFAVTVTRAGEEWQLTGHAWGEPPDPARHRLRVEVKAATYAALQVMEAPRGHWRARCVVDV